MFTELLATQAFLPDISYASDLLTLIDKFNFFRIADNYPIEQLILHNHITEADLTVIDEKKKLTVVAAECHVPLKNWLKEAKIKSI